MKAKLIVAGLVILTFIVLIITTSTNTSTNSAQSDIENVIDYQENAMKTTSPCHIQNASDLVNIKDYTCN